MLDMKNPITKIVTHVCHKKNTVETAAGVSEGNPTPISTNPANLRKDTPIENSPPVGVSSPVRLPDMLVRFPVKVASTGIDPAPITKKAESIP